MGRVDQRCRSTGPGQQCGVQHEEYKWAPEIRLAYTDTHEYRQGLQKKTKCLSDDVCQMLKWPLYYTVTFSRRFVWLLWPVGHFWGQQPGSPAPTDVVLQEHKLEANEMLPEETHHWSSRSNFLVSNAKVK